MTTPEIHTMRDHEIKRDSSTLQTSDTSPAPDIKPIEPVEEVKETEPAKEESEEDLRIKKLTKIIHRQGQLIILLLIAIVAVFVIKTQDIKLPDQTPDQGPPPLSQEDIQYQINIFQNSIKLNQGASVNDPRVNVLGNVYDLKNIRETFKDFAFLVNDAEVPLDPVNGSFQVDLTLKPGSNIINTSYTIEGKNYDRRQIVIYFQPQTQATSTVPVFSPMSSPAATSATVTSQP